MATKQKRSGLRAKLAEIKEFLAHKRIALIGVSRNAQDYTRVVMRELLSRDHDVVPVNPYAGEVEGRRCFARVQDVQPGVAAALVFTAPEDTEQAVRDCAAAGVRQVWLRRGARELAEAVSLCEEKGIRVIAGQCPLMFLPEAGFVHRFHGHIAWVFGQYPR